MQQITNELDALLEVFPPTIRDLLEAFEDTHTLIEVVLDLGRPPEVRFVDREILLSDQEVTQTEIDYITGRISPFMSDNRSGIERTLHRISAIKNRHGKVIGLTCRVGRAVFGTVDIVRDILESGQSMLLLGRPGVGKTTILREAARTLAEQKRVVIVDTSNEIAGDGDIPHSAIGRARRMQVADHRQQHAVMIEAVENHMPEVVVIDEIGRSEEAEAARTIAERGVQLVGTAHGNSLQNLLMNPTLSDLIGGIDTVTLSDEEARRRGTQKSVLERRSPPTFDVLVEIQDRQTFVVHPDVMKAVDAILRQQPPSPETRYRDEEGNIQVEQAAPLQPAIRGPHYRPRNGYQKSDSVAFNNRDALNVQEIEPPRNFELVRIFPYGVGQNRLRQAAKSMHLPVEIVEGIEDADVVMTLKPYYRKHPQPIVQAEQIGKPVYVLRSNTVVQMEMCLTEVFSLNETESGRAASALRETQDAIERVLHGTRSVELQPQNSNIRREQHQLVRQAKLLSHSLGREPHRRVRVLQNAQINGRAK